MNPLAFVKGYKTYIIAALMVAVGLVNLLTGDLTLISFLHSPDLYLLLNGLGLTALRAALQ